MHYAVGHPEFVLTHLIDYFTRIDDTDRRRSRYTTIPRAKQQMGEQAMLTALPNTAGTYVMILRNRTRQAIAVGRLGEVTARIGYYLYVGSAFGPGGLRARLAHHLSVTAHPHWHVDYLRRATEPAAIWFQQHTTREEHRWASALARGRWIEVGHARFGASDCACPSHLFFSTEAPDVITFRRRLRALGIPGSACAWSPAEAA